MENGLGEINNKLTRVEEILYEMLLNLIVKKRSCVHISGILFSRENYKGRSN